MGAKTFWAATYTLHAQNLGLEMKREASKNDEHTKIIYFMGLNFVHPSYSLGQFIIYSPKLFTGQVTYRKHKHYYSYVGKHDATEYYIQTSYINLHLIFTMSDY